MAATNDITIDQNANYWEIVTVRVLANPLLPESIDNPKVVQNLTGYTAQMQVIDAYETRKDIILFDMTNGLSIPNPTDGQIWLVITPAVSSSIALGRYDSVDYVYVLEAADAGGDVIRVCEGTFTVRRTTDDI